LRSEFPAEDFGDPEDQAEVQRLTEGVAPEQLGVALDHVLKGLAGTGEVDCEALARDIGVTPERAYEMVARMVDAHSRLVTANLFSGDADLHQEFVQWALKNDRAAYVKASEAVARTQSSKPMSALVQRRIAALRESHAKQSKQSAKQSTRSESKATTGREREIEAVRRGLWEREEAHRREREAHRHLWEDDE